MLALSTPSAWRRHTCHARAMRPDVSPWLVVIDAQQIFAAPDSAWASPAWPDVEPRIRALVEAAAERVVFTRFVADPGLGGSWRGYYDEWPFALRLADDPAYAVVPGLADLAEAARAEGREVVEPTFGKWTPALRGVVGDQPALRLVGVATDCCVLSTALAAADAGASVEILAEACAGSSPQAQAEALSTMGRYAPQITVVAPTN